MRIFALIFSCIFLAVGIGGFIPEVLNGDMLVNVFRVNAWTNALHILTGLCALAVAFLNERACRVFFQICGVVFAFFSVAGFIYEDRIMFRVFANNLPNTWFHVIMSISALVLGFGSKVRNNSI